MVYSGNIPAIIGFPHQRAGGNIYREGLMLLYGFKGVANVVNCNIYRGGIGTGNPDTGNGNEVGFFVSIGAHQNGRLGIHQVLGPDFFLFVLKVVHRYSRVSFYFIVLVR